MNFAFAYPWVLLLLLAVPLLAIYRFAPRFRRRQQGSFLFSNAHLFGEQPRSFRQYLLPVLDLIVLLAITLAIFALARPQAIEMEEVDVDGIDIFVALDMSGSMRAIDITEHELRRLERQGQSPISRFDAAVHTLRDFVKTRHHDRIGIVLFAREAFLHFPLTLDHNMIASSLEHLRLTDIDEGGTAIGNALGRAIAGLKESTADTKILILITDGDRRGGNISPIQAAEIARDLGIVVYPILIGRDGLAMVPAGRDVFSRRTTYRQVEFPIDPDLLQEIAATTGGKFFRAQDGISMRDDLHAILNEYDRSRLQDVANVEYRELYRPLVLWMIVLLSLQFILRHTLCRTFP